MRVISGLWRGKRLQCLTGDTTRPTTDRVKEALMSSVFSASGGFQDAVVLDAFAGSGALGIEALSRGAAFVLFCELNARACDIVKKNLLSVGAEATSYRVLKRDVLKNPPAGAVKPFDIVFLDPPYRFASSVVEEFVATLDDSGALSPKAIVVYEHAVSKDCSEFPLLEEGFSVVSSKQYGEIAVDVYRKDNSSCER